MKNVLQVKKNGVKVMKSELVAMVAILAKTKMNFECKNNESQIFAIMCMDVICLLLSIL